AAVELESSSATHRRGRLKTHNGLHRTLTKLLDHRGVKQRLVVMLGFKRFRSAGITVAGVELMQRIRKGQHEL
ncbi:MAG: uncharacterized protein JWR00_1181, partial [Rubritepida sp.]|nr:uncharacterized protein [Rubritepida sp.]